MSLCIDISFAQGFPVYSQIPANISHIIAKAGGGESGDFHLDSKWTYNRDNTRLLGRVLGSYFFNGPVDPTLAAQWYLSIIDWRAGELMMLDVESSSGVVRWNCDQALAFCQYIKQQTGVSIVVYMSSSVTREENWQPLVDLGCPLMVASYGANDGSVGSAPSIRYWTEWILWQYTSVATYPGFSGNVDTSLISDKLDAYLGTNAPIITKEDDMLLYGIVQDQTPGTADYGSEAIIGEGVPDGTYWMQTSFGLGPRGTSDFWEAITNAVQGSSSAPLTMSYISVNQDGWDMAKAFKRIAPQGTIDIDALATAIAAKIVLPDGVAPDANAIATAVVSGLSSKSITTTIA